MASRGEIPGAAKIGATWSFNIVMLDAFVNQKERETCQNRLRHRRVVSGAVTPSMPAYRPAALTSNGHYEQTIRRLRQRAARQSAAE
jgi:hypothetical protein